MAYSIYDSTEEAIQKMIEASQKIINEQHNSSVVNRDFKLKIKTLENAPRDEEKLERLLKVKKRQKEEAMHIEDTQKGWLQRRLKMLKIVFYIW